MALGKTEKKLLVDLAALYGEPESELDFEDEYQLVVAVLLSAQSTDKKVNQITPELFRAYPNFARLALARVEDVEKLIQQVNYYKTKAKHLVLLGEKVMKEFSGCLPRSHQELTSLPGVGNKTANVVLSELGIQATFPVDTHVFRVSKRLNLASANTADKVEAQLKQLFPEKHWRNLHHWLIFHGRRICKAQRPLCDSCTLSSYCPSVQNAVD